MRSTTPPVDAPAGLVLAAGAGTRLGLPKALAVVAGRPLVGRAVDLLHAAGCTPIVVVLGAGAADVRTSLAAAEPPEDEVTRGVDVRLVDAPDWAAGQSHSLRTGLDEVARAGARAAVVALVDQPLVTAAAVSRLIAAWRDGAVAVTATYAGRPRPPVVLDAAVWRDVAGAVHGDRGAGPWLRANADLTRQVEVGDVADAFDVDTAGDLAVVQRRLSDARP